jgi:hypothetical protein
LKMRAHTTEKERETVFLTCGRDLCATRR